MQAIGRRKLVAVAGLPLAGQQLHQAHVIGLTDPLQGLQIRDMAPQQTHEVAQRCSRAS